MCLDTTTQVPASVSYSNHFVLDHFRAATATQESAIDMINAPCEGGAGSVCAESKFGSARSADARAVHWDGAQAGMGLKSASTGLVKHDEADCKKWCNVFTWLGSRISDANVSEVPLYGRSMQPLGFSQISVSGRVRSHYSADILYVNVESQVSTEHDASVAMLDLCSCILSGASGFQ